MRIPKSLIAQLLLLPLLSACFTGVESTPKISDSELRKLKDVQAGEPNPLSDIRHSSLSQWLPGHRLKVADNRVSLVLYPPQAAPAQGDMLTYLGVDSVGSLTGIGASVVKFISSKGDTLVHKVNMPKEELLRRNDYMLPFTVDMSLVDSVKARINHSRLYILTRLWCDSLGNKITGEKFVPVTVTDVLPGNDTYPILVMFVTDNGKKAGVLMTAGASRSDTRNFDTLFSVTDPHKRYPMISDENWNLIKQGKVVEDMTRDECRLSLGSPATIDRIPGYSGVTERWSYTSGAYLIFDNGRLIKARYE